MATKTNIVQLRAQLKTASSAKRPEVHTPVSGTQQLLEKRSKSGVVRERYFISSARRALTDVHQLLDTDKTYELYNALVNRTVSDMEVRDEEFQMTPLTKVACKLPSWDAKKRQLWMKILIKFGANVNAVDAEKNNQTILAQLLLLKKEDTFCDFVDTDSKLVLNYFTVDKDGNNLLHLAAYHGLLKACNVINARTIGFGNPLHEAYNHKGQTPLMIACENGDVAMAKTLVEAGADLTIREANCRYGSQMAIEILAATLLSNYQQRQENEAETRQILERLIRSSCKFMIAAGQLSKMARLLRWCATSLLGQAKARDLCQEFRPKLTKPLVYSGPMPSAIRSALKSAAVTAAAAASRKTTPVGSGVQSPGESAVPEPASARAFDMPLEIHHVEKSNDRAPLPEQMRPRSVVFSLLDNYSYLWTASYKRGVSRHIEKLRPYEHAYLVNTCGDFGEESADLMTSDGATRLHRMSLLGGPKAKQTLAGLGKLKRNLSNKKIILASTPSSEFAATL